MNILVSACLLGVCCRYDGKCKPSPEVIRLKERFSLIPVCPECYGGLPIPREPGEILDGQVFLRGGANVTEQYHRGAEAALHLAKLLSCDIAVLKEKSPSCGSGKIHNGLFDGGLTDGDGITAALLKKNGIRVLGESEVAALADGAFDIDCAD